MKIKSFLILISISILFVTPLLGQSDKDKSGFEIMPIKKLQPKDGENIDQMQTVRQLMARRAYISAADLLEKIYSEQPDNVEVINSLLRCYTELKAIDKAETLLKTRLEKNPFDFIFHKRLIDLYLQIGEDSLAENQIKITLEKFPDNTDIYSAIVRDMINFNYFDMAIKYIDSGRVKFNNPDLLAMDAARIFETTRDYNRAVEEYFKAFNAADSNMVNQAERRMSMLIRYPDAPEEIIRAMTAILDSLPDNTYALKFLQEAYIKNEQFEKAFDVCLKLDSLSNDQGQTVFRYMKLCLDRKLYDQVIRTADYINRQNYDHIPFGDYRFYYAKALEGIGQYHKAIAAYGDIISSYPRKNDQADGLLMIGKIYRYDLKDYDSARVYFDSVVNTYQVFPTYYTTREEIGLLHIVQGNLDSAQTVFADLMSKYRQSEDRERMQYDLAMIELYRMRYEEANTAFRRLIAQYPRGYYVNDALINSLIITESQGMFQDALNSYVEALYYKARMMPDSMAVEYRRVADDILSPLAGLSLYRLAEYYTSEADTSQALDLIDEMADKHGEDYFYPYGLKLKGDILLERGQTEPAEEIYQTILEKYNRYPFTGEVRTIMQELTEQKPAS